jgi:hypothetical protein
MQVLTVPPVILSEGNVKRGLLPVALGGQVRDRRPKPLARDARWHRSAGWGWG